MKRLLVLAAVLCAGVFAAAQNTGFREQAFVAGGDIRMDLSAGDYDVSASTDDHIRVSWRSDHNQDAARVRTQIDVNGRNATVTTNGPHNNMHYVVEVPKSANITIRLSAGDLRISNLEGNKDVQVHAGDLRIVVGDPQKYGQVDLSVNAGDINASPFGGSKDGLFRSYHWTGKGSYRLHAHLGAGDINLVSSDSI